MYDTPRQVDGKGKIMYKREGKKRMRERGGHGQWGFVRLMEAPGLRSGRLHI